MTAIWKPFLAAGKRGGEVAKEKALRTRLANEAAQAAKAKERQPLAD